MALVLPLRTRTPPACSSARPAIKIENNMISGHGRLILRDGTELPVGYCLFYAHCFSWCSGMLIGNIRSVDPGTFSKPIEVALDDGRVLLALGTGHSDRHVRFVAQPVDDPERVRRPCLSGPLATAF